MRRQTLTIALLLAALPLSCGADKNAGPPENPYVVLTVKNESSYDIEDLRTHTDLSYIEAHNLLPDNELLVDDASFQIDKFRSGDHVTVMWRNAAGGKLVAYTTKTGLDTPKDGYILKVFADAFRLVPPADDGGPRDDGAAPGDP